MNQKKNQAKIGSLASLKRGHDLLWPSEPRFRQHAPLSLPD